MNECYYNHGSVVQSHIAEYLIFHRSTGCTKGLPLLKEEKKMTMQHVTFSTTCMQRRAFAKEATSLRCNWHFSYARLQRHSKDIQRNETCKLLRRMMFDVVFFLFPVKPAPKKRELSPLSALTRKPGPHGGNCCSCRYSAVAQFQSSSETAIWLRPTLGKT